MANCMTRDFESFVETEYDAAIYVYCLIALADGEVFEKEIKSINEEVDLLGLDIFDDFKEYKLSNWRLFIENLHNLTQHFDYDHVLNSVSELANHIESHEIRQHVLDSVYRIAFSDSDYHYREKNLIKLLAAAWDL